MKRTIAVLTLPALTLFCRADGYFRGAQFCTKAPAKSQLYAGAIEVTFYTDKTVEVDFYAGADYLETVEGTYVETSAGWIFRVTDSDGWNYFGFYNFRKDLLTGGFASPFNTYKGKFQCTFINEDEADAKSTAKTKQVKK